MKEQWILSQGMLQRINMKTLQRHLYSMYFITPHLQIEHYGVSLYVSSTFSLWILFSQWVHSREQIFLSVACPHIYGTPPRYRFHYKNICILSKIRYTRLNSYTKKKQRVYIQSKIPFCFSEYSSYITSSSSWKVFKRLSCSYVLSFIYHF